MSNRALAFTAERLLHILKSFPGVPAYVVAYSGGADSTALLHALVKVRDQLGVPVSAVHINHGIHDDSDHWQTLCENFCLQNQVELVTLKIRLEHRQGKGLEAEARHLRYAAITDLLPPGAGLLTAHHADDQAETLLLNLMRGSGVDGLSAMPESRKFGKGVLQRPLLGFQSRALKNYLSAHNVEWIEDPSNQFLNHDRNFVRHEIIPMLEKRWPEVSKRLLLTRKAMTGARHLLEKLADDYLGQNLHHPFVLEMTKQLADDMELFKLVIRRWLTLADTPTIPVYRLETFYEQVQKAHNGQNITVTWDGRLLRPYGQKLWLCEDTGISSCPDVRWPAGSKEIDLGGDHGLLALQPGGSNEGHLSDASGRDDLARHPLLSVDEFSVGSRITTKATAICHGGHHKSLKNLYQQAGIPAWLRDSIPLCRIKEELVAMGDWCLTEQYAAWLSANNVRLSWQPRHPLLQYVRDQQHTAAVDRVGAVR